MDEYSRMIIEEYCMDHDSAKSRRLYALVRKSYDLYAEYSDSDGAFIEKTIRQEENPEFKAVLEDLNGFMCGY